jgi:hypothetical protein
MDLTRHEFPSVAGSHPRIGGAVVRRQRVTEVALCFVIVVHDDRRITVPPHFEGGNRQGAGDAVRQRRDLFQQLWLVFAHAVLRDVDRIGVQVPVPDARVTRCHGIEQRLRLGAEQCCQIAVSGRRESSDRKQRGEGAHREWPA